ncbi:MAG TPA: GNAT family N-acetyltransferase [Acidimicrobiaceae bacterium]|nr:GNAT family N-acetyltransferase [Acidimicrobiaceae bacterium]
MSGYRLRAATEHDIPVLVRGRVRMFEDMATFAGTVFDPSEATRIGDASAALFAAGWGHDHVGWLVEHAGVAVASAMVSVQAWLPHPRYPSGERPYFHSVHTDPAHRGHGLARRLTETAIEWASDRGFTHFVLHASEQGRPIYERLGFANSSEWILPLR